MAAEDPDPTARLNAMRRLTSEVDDGALSNDAVGTLLRRVRTDNDVCGAATAAAVLYDCSIYAPSANDVVVAVEQWSLLCGTAAVDDDPIVITRSLIGLCR